MKYLIIVLILFGLLTPFFSNAAFSLFGRPFGGRIKNVTWCSCSFNFLISISPPRGGMFIFDPRISRPYLFYQFFRAGPWVVGTSSGNASCMQYSGNSCVQTGSGSIIRKIGTSLW